MRATLMDFNILQVILMHNDTHSYDMKNLNPQMLLYDLKSDVRTLKLYVCKSCLISPIFIEIL